MEQARVEGRPEGFLTRLQALLISPILLWALCGLLTAAVILLSYDDLANIRSYRAAIRDERRLENDSAAYQELNEFLKGGHTQQVTLHESAMVNFAPTGHATYLASTGRLILTAANIPQLPPGKVYELWLLPADGGDPVPAGTFVPDLAGNGAIIFPKLIEPEPAKGFAISVENMKGATKPTMPWILSGQ